MSRYRYAIAIGVFALFVLTSLEYSFGQSGSRNSYRRPSTPRITREQQAAIQQQNAFQQQANAEARRKQLLNQYAANPNSRENRTQYSSAYDDAKAEFMAIRQGSIPVAGRRLQRPFLLRSNELNRAKRKIRWPKTLLQDQHKETVVEIEKFIADMKKNAQDLRSLIERLALQIEQRVVERSIDIKDYAKAKRFISGLANETDL